MMKIYLQPKEEDLMVRELNKATITFEFSCLPDSFGLEGSVLGGCYSLPWMALIYPSSQPYNIEW